ncbi:MAG: nucleotidyltransferase family protein [Acidobacteria bacterium]|nr:MAG: nucleotidyltransferase family protein [Acidobacteriota bacterium]
MKAFLLAAGLGTRMRPLTDATPKCLLPVRGVPMLAIWLDLCHRHGISEVLINAHTHGDQVRDYLAAHRNGVKTTMVEEPVLLGSAGTILANRKWVEGEGCFWIIYADVLTNASLGRMMQFHRERRGLATLGGYEVPDPERCGIMEVDAERRIHRFVEKPKAPVGRLAFSGLMIADAAVLDRIPAGPRADLGFDVLPRLAGEMYAWPISDYLLDMGTLENYERAQKTWPGLD